MIYAAILIPFLCGLCCLLLKSLFMRKLILLCTSLVHLALTILIITGPNQCVIDGWINIDGLSKITLFVTSLLFTASSCYGFFYLNHVTSDSTTGIDPEKLTLRDNRFCACLLLFLASMSLVSVAENLGVIWIAVEATTLASAPLIYFYRHHRSLEATWKYLIICSLGIALALLGNYFLAAGTITKDGIALNLSLKNLIDHAHQINPVWLKAAFILFLVGYGTKMGLVPMHTWLPDAHSEAPAMISALLSGALLNCAFLAILRVMSVLNAAGLASFAQELLLIFGLVSMFIASLLLLTQIDFKRMLAYSSIEHMGILAVAVGLGGLGRYAAMLHLMNHSLVKAALFLTAGNILLLYRTKDSHHLGEMTRRCPWNALLWSVGIMAICGAPPFGLFLSELTILKTIISQNSPVVAVVYLLALSIAFAAIFKTALRMLYDSNPQSEKVMEPFYEHPLSIMPQVLLLCGSLVYGLWIPTFFNDLFCNAAKLGGI